MLSAQRFALGRDGTALFGVGSVSELAPIVGAVGGSRVLLVTDAGVAGAGVAGVVAGVLEGGNVEVGVYAGVRPNPSLADCDAAVEETRHLEPRAVVAVGGGSVIDAAKALALMLANDGPARDFEYRRMPVNEALPLIAVPTTAGTGAETNSFGVIEDQETHRKLYVGHSSTLPRWVVLDPQLTIGVPAGPTAAAGIDTMAHAFESLSSRRSNPYAEGLNLEVVRMVFHHLPRAVADGGDLEARSQLLLAAHMAGMAMATTGLGLAHGVGHSLSARLGAPHGVALGVLLPHVLRFNTPVLEELYARVAVGLGLAGPGAGDRDNAGRLVSAIREFVALLSMPPGLGKLGLDTSLIPLVAADALEDEVTANAPREPDAAQLEALLIGAL